MQKANETGKAFLQNSLRLFISPRPNNLVERRHIFQSLQNYGEILHFKSNYYDRTIHSPDTALLIFRERQSYDRLILESPVTIRVERRPFDPVSLHSTYPKDGEKQSPLDLNFRQPEFPEGKYRKPEHNSTPFLPFDLASIETDEEKQEREQRQMDKYMKERVLPEMIDFKITATPLVGYQRAHLEHTPYWSNFRVRQSLMSQELRKTAPLYGLTDVDVFKKAHPLPIIHRRRTRLANTKTLRQVYEESVAANKTSKA